MLCVGLWRLMGGDTVGVVEEGRRGREVCGIAQFVSLVFGT